ncbi:IMPACT family protein [Niabella terrae]
MEIPDYYNTIENSGEAVFRDRGSRFIARAIPIKSAAQVKTQLAAVKQEYPKASHYCFAWRLGIDGQQFRVNDDGEPSGSAGRPILGQIDSRGVTDLLIVVVRYFGGTLLGVPGLINAYKSAAAMALQVTPLVRKAVLIKYELQFDYTRMNDIMIIIRQFDCEILAQEMQLFCMMQIGIPRYRLTETLRRLEDLQGLTITASKIS